MVRLLRRPFHFYTYLITALWQLKKSISQWNVSPKLDFKKEITIEKANNVHWKFVIRNQKDIEQTKHFCQKNTLPPSQICLQPEGITKAAILKKLPLVMKTASQLGVRVSPRLHILLWNNEKGK